MACITQVIKKLGGEFAIKDFGNLHYFLGIGVKPFPSGLFSLTSKICEGPSSSNEDVREFCHQYSYDS